MQKSVFFSQQLTHDNSPWEPLLSTAGFWYKAVNLAMNIKQIDFGKVTNVFVEDKLLTWPTQWKVVKCHHVWWHMPFRLISPTPSALICVYTHFVFVTCPTFSSNSKMSKYSFNIKSYHFSLLEPVSLSSSCKRVSLLMHPHYQICSSLAASGLTWVVIIEQLNTSNSTEEKEMSHYKLKPQKSCFLPVLHHFTFIYPVFFLLSHVKCW